MFSLLAVILFRASFFVTSSTVLGDERSTLNVDTIRYFAALSTEVNSMLSDKPVFDTEHFKTLAAEIQGAPFYLALSGATVVEIKNVTYEMGGDMEISSTGSVFGEYFTLGESSLRFKFVLTQTSDRITTEGNVTLVFSNMKEHVKIAVRKEQGSKLVAEVVEEHLFFPGTVKSVEVSPPTSLMDKFALSIYNDGDNPVDVATEVTDAFELYFNQAVEKVDVSKYVSP